MVYFIGFVKLNINHGLKCQTHKLRGKKIIILMALASLRNLKEAQSQNVFHFGCFLKKCDKSLHTSFQPNVKKLRLVI